LSPCLDFLITAGLVHPILHTSAQGQPLGAQANPDLFKILFVDVALASAMLGKGGEKWLLNLADQIVNKGEIIEAFVGQEILSNSDPHTRASLYFWHREKAPSMAEVDYVITSGEQVIPIEVKSGSGGHLKSMQQFLATHPHSPYGLRFYAGQYELDNEKKINSIPLYAVAAIHLLHQKIND
jgi:predicted AAA+ superfamily ATPase